MPLQALLTLPYQVQDSGTLDCPIMLPLSNSTFQGLINDWRNQYAVHGLQYSGGVVCFCLRRYTENRRKNMCRIAITPGSRVNLPHFQAPTESTEVESQAYHAAFVILHLGEVITSGHYQAALSVPCLDHDPPTWSFWLCDDKRSPRPASPKDPCMLWCTTGGYCFFA